MGYDEHHQLTKTARARRVYCSNRLHASGCGRTFSVWLAERVKHSYLSAKSLWQFLSEAVNLALPHFRKTEREQAKPINKTAIYRLCIEKGWLHAERVARTTFCRMVDTYEMLKEDPGENKRRLAFSMQYANQLWQADTMFGPHIGGKQTKLIAFIDDASRVLCHGEFFLEENKTTTRPSIPLWE